MVEAIMDSEVIIIQDKFNLIMQTISKVIEKKFNSSAQIISLENIKLLENYIPRLLIVDKTVFDNDAIMESDPFILLSPEIKIFLITLENDLYLNRYISNKSNFEIINLWQRRLSVVDHIVQSIGDTLEPFLIN